MILIPGLSSPGSVWDSTVAHFKETHEAHVLHLAGFAGAEARQPGPVLKPVRDALASYIRERKLTDPVVVGHSLGGFIALDLASSHPDLVGSLVIVDALPFMFGITNPEGSEEQARAGAQQMAQFFASMNDEAYNAQIRSGMATRNMVLSDADHERIIEWSLASDRSTVARAMTDMFSTDLRNELAAITAPTLVLGVWRGFEAFTTRERNEAIFNAQFALLPDVRIEIGDTARHFIMLDDPKWMFARIEAFFDSLPNQ